MYAPHIKSAKLLHRYRLAPYTFALFGDIEQQGLIEYLYVLVAFKDGDHSPRLFVAAEVNEVAQHFGGGSHFLGIFDEEGHANMGAADEWGDLERFTEEALTIATTRLALEGTPTQVA